MNLSQKKNCNSCRALLGTGAHEFECLLGFSLRSEAVGTSYIPFYNLYPNEPCYKPKTYGQYIEARKILGLN